MNKSPRAQPPLSPSSKSRKVSVGILGAVLAALALSQSSVCRSTRSQVQRVANHPTDSSVQTASPQRAPVATVQEDRPEGNDAGDEMIMPGFIELSDNERGTATAIVQQVLQEQRSAMLRATTAADVREIVIDALSRAVESDEDHPPAHSDTCARFDRSYLSSGSQRRLVASIQAACTEMSPLVHEQVRANDIASAILLAEALQDDCGVRNELPDPFQLAIDQGRFDLVTAILEARMNTMHEKMACYPNELADAGNGPRIYIMGEVLTPFISHHPGYLSSLTWSWTPDLLECAHFALMSVSMSYISGFDRNVPRDALARDRVFIQSRRSVGALGDGSVVTP
jgi:hypothetical protein